MVASSYFVSSSAAGDETDELGNKLVTDLTRDSFSVMPASVSSSVEEVEPMLTGQLWPRGAEFVYVAPPPSPSIRSATYANNGGAGVTTMTVTLPAGVVAGDKLVVAMMSTDTQSGAAVTASTTGWTEVTTKADQGTCQRAFYYATYSAGLAMPSWNIASARKCVWACVAIQDSVGTPQVTPTDVSSSSTDVVAPLKAIGAQSVWLRFYVRKDNLSTSVTPPAGSTLVTGALGTATGPSGHILVYSQVPSGGPSVPNATATFSAASANGTGWTVCA
jgi:hypothetical protein